MELTQRLLSPFILKLDKIRNMLGVDSAADGADVKRPMAAAEVLRFFGNTSTLWVLPDTGPNGSTVSIWST